jgi:hypothetical protein
VAGLFAVGEAEIGVAELAEVAADEDDLLPGVLGDEVDDGLVFGEAFGAEFGHGAKDEDFVGGVGASRSAKFSMAARMLEGLAL